MFAVAVLPSASVATVRMRHSPGVFVGSEAIEFVPVASRSSVVPVRGSPSDEANVQRSPASAFASSKSSEPPKAGLSASTTRVMVSS